MKRGLGVLRCETPSRGVGWEGDAVLRRCQCKLVHIGRKRSLDTAGAGGTFSPTRCVSAAYRQRWGGCPDLEQQAPMHSRIVGATLALALIAAAAVTITWHNQ